MSISCNMIPCTCGNCFRCIKCGIDRGHYEQILETLLATERDRGGKIECEMENRKLKAELEQTKDSLKDQYEIRRDTEDGKIAILQGKIIKKLESENKRLREALEHCAKYSSDLFDDEDGLSHSPECPACLAKAALAGESAVNGEAGE